MSVGDGRGYPKNWGHLFLALGALLTRQSLRTNYVDSGFCSGVLTMIRLTFQVVTYLWIKGLVDLGSSSSGC